MNIPVDIYLPGQVSTKTSGTTKATTHTPMDIPDWFCPYKIPPELSGSIPPLVCLAGLNVESNNTHRAIWEMMKLKPSSKEFKPAYVIVPLTHKFSAKKPKQEHLETYTPHGIFKTNWLKKHTQLIPSVLVVFFDMNWTDLYWNERKNECVERIRFLKKDVSPHGTQVLVMLIKTAEAGEDNFSTDRASTLCAAADIPPKALYILSHTHIERIQACVQRLELGMKEASKVYYSGRIRRVKNWKDRVTDLALLTRYNFKISFFQEIRRDYVSAISHYQAAFDSIRSMTDTEWCVQQIRCVSAWISYRICRLNLLRLDFKESFAHFEKHIRFFRNLMGNEELHFEQMAWLQQQYCMFGELLRHYYRAGSTSLDPVTFFLTAVNYAERRLQYHDDRLNNLQFPVEMQKYLKDCDLEYVGQRPWRQDDLSKESYTTKEDPNAIKTLRIFEQKYNLSDEKIILLGTASDFCRDPPRLRTRCQLMMMMGMEFYAQAEHQRCIMLMSHVLREFGRDKGTSLLYLVAECGLRAAFCAADIPAYLGFLLFLLKLDFRENVPQERRETLWHNYLNILDQKCPTPEKECSLSTSNWTTALNEKHAAYIGVHSECIITAMFSFVGDTFRAGTPAEVKVVLTNKNHADIKIKKFGAGISIPDYNCEAIVDLCIPPGEVHTHSLFFTPVMKDVGKIIQLHMGYVDIGRNDISVIMHYSMLTSISPYLWNDEKKDKGEQIIAKIEPMIPLLTLKISHADRILVNEWHKVTVTCTNTDAFDYSKINITFLVSVPDPSHPSDIILTTDPSRHPKRGHLTHTVDAEVLGPGASVEFVVYVKCWSNTTSDLKFIIKAKYTDNCNQTVVNDLVHPIEVIQPFSTTYQAKNLQTDDVTNVLSREEFIVNFQFKNTSGCALFIEEVKVTKTLPIVEAYVAHGSELSAITMKADEVVNQIVSYRLLASTDLPICQVEVTWRRWNEDVHTSATSISVTPVSLTKAASIYVEGVFFSDGKGELRKPMQVKYCIQNRSDKLYHLNLTMDSSECFMNAGPKKNTVKLTAFETVDIGYILFPLKTGLLKTPRILLEHLEGVGGELPGSTENPSIIHKNIVRYVFVSRAEDSVKHVNQEKPASVPNLSSLKLCDLEQ